MKNMNLISFKSLLSHRKIKYKEQKEGNVTLIIPVENLNTRVFDSEGMQI